MNDGSELLKRSGESSGGLGSSGEVSSLLSGWLVEPGLNESGPVLSEMNVGELIVVLYHLAKFIYSIINKQ